MIRIPVLPEKTLRNCLVFYLLACTALNFLPLFKHTHPLDLITLYTAGSMVRAHENPYEDAALKHAWRTIATKQALGQHEKECEPGIPTALLYTPNTLLAYSFLSVAPWRFMTVTNRLAQAALLVLMLIILWRMQSGKTLYGFMLLALALTGFKGLAWFMSGLNPTVFAMFFIILFYWAYKKNRQVLAGLFLGIATLKITLVIPFILFILLRRKWKIALYFLLAAIVPYVYLFITDAAYTSLLISSWLHGTQEWDSLLYAIFPNGGTWHGREIWEWNRMLDCLTSLGPLLSYYFKAVTGAASFVMVKSLVLIFGALLFAITILVDRKKKIADELLLVMLLCIELMVNYHLYYDACVPVLLLMMARQSIPGSMYIPLIVATSFFYLPYNGLLIRLEVPKQLYLWMFNMAVPVLLLFLCIAGSALGGKPGEIGKNQRTVAL
jgi:hypothetical protein